jgi:hypothetical protein
MKKQFIFIGAILAVIIIIYIIITIKRKNSSTSTSVDNKKAGTNGAYTDTIIPTTTSQNDIFPLKRGSNHEAVKYLKQALNYVAKKRGVSGVNLILTTDANIFGTVTETAIYRLYTTKICTKALAQQIANDADLPEVALILDSFK